MKRVTELNHYEVLDLKPTATKAEIQQSFSKLKKTYDTDSLAVYSILSDEEREYMLVRVEEAYKILIDEEKRKKYDESIGFKPFEKRQETEEARPPLPKQAKKRESKKEEPVQEAESIDPLCKEFLKKTREIKGVSLTEISEATNIKSHFLSSLENGDYGELPGRAYAVGFLREYAKYVGLDYQVAKEHLEVWGKWK
ncbi:MAG: helix-turn-helix domain-containing protein [bacterium]